MANDIERGGHDEAQQLGYEEQLETATETATKRLKTDATFDQVVGWYLQVIDPKYVFAIADGSLPCDETGHPPDSSPDVGF